MAISDWEWELAAAEVRAEELQAVCALLRARVGRASSAAAGWRRAATQLLPVPRSALIWLWVKTRSHFGVGAPPMLINFSGDWDVHWKCGILTHD